MILENIYKKKKSNKKLFSLLVDPDKYGKESLIKTITITAQYGADFIFVGGSLISNYLNETIKIIKNESDIPVVLFPGSCLQISNLADGILFLSLISGRNPDFLIGNHVIAAPILKNSNIEVVPTGYILINEKKTTSVEYMSNTTPIPPEKIDIITATAQAGEMLGLKLIYLEAGSGAVDPVKPAIISNIKNNIDLPIIVGGGLNNTNIIKNVLKAGADMVVVGNAIENNNGILKDIISATKNF